ncbi:MAG: acyltransferase [Gaiellaceae bacterium]
MWQSIYRLYGVRANVSLGKNVHIGLGTILWAPKKLTVGNDVYIGKGCTIECDGTIGSGVLIANRVGIIGRRDHDIGAIGVPIRQAPWAGDSDGPDSGSVQIGADVWIGYGAVILSGIVVGRGAVVAAGSVVTHDVPPYTIVVGNPARVAGERFDERQRVEHERLLLDRGFDITEEDA